MSGRKVIAGLLLVLCLLAGMAVPFLPIGLASKAVQADSATIYVPDNYSTIQTAVDAASDGDTIIVSDGTYTENVDVNKQLTIQSENGAEVTTVQAAEPNDHVFEVTADYVSIDGFTAIGATGTEKAGIYLASGTDHCTILNNKCGYDSNHRNMHGISLVYSSNNAILNNVTNSNIMAGIYLIQSNSNTIFNNTSSSNYFGLNLQSGLFSNTIYLNSFVNNAGNFTAQSSSNNWHSPTEICYAYGGARYKSYLGNRWGDYTGSDDNNDGIGDTAHNLPYYESNDDSYPLMTNSYYYSLQAWYLHSDDKMYKGDSAKSPGTVAVPGGGSSGVWIADSVALVDIDFAADTDNKWIGQITFATAPAGGDSFRIDIGYSTDGNDFTSGGPQATFIGDGGQEVFLLDASVASFGMPLGKYLALRITNNSDSSYAVQTGGVWSYISSPVTDTGYPGVENQPPSQPINSSPSDGATSISITPILQSSVFSDPDVTDTHTASQWQVTATPGDYSSPVFDSGTDSSKLTFINIPAGNLNNNTTYYWRVRHQDNHGAWSAWSAETCFNTTPGIPQLEWHRTFGGSSKDYADSVQQTSDGGYIIVGQTESYGAGENDVWLIRTDSNGNELWDKTFGNSAEDYGESVQQTSDGGYIVAGTTASYGAGGPADVWLIKTDSEGNKLWDKTFGGSLNDYGKSVQQTSDGGYIIVGDTWSSGAGKMDVWLIKTDSNGNKVWDKTFGSPDIDWGKSVQQTADGGYVVAAVKAHSEDYKGDAWLIKTDSSGNELWNESFGGSADDFGKSVQQTSDGGYIIGGHTESYGAGAMDAWLIKTDSNGNKLWDKTFGGPGDDYGPYVQQTSDGGYIIGGTTESYGAGDSDVWLIRTDSNGDQLWDKTFGDSDFDSAQSVQQTSDGGYVIAGYTVSYGAGDCDVWLLKVTNPPNQPSNTSPSDGATSVSLTPTLESSTFSDPDSGDSHAASQWQITTTSGDYSSPVFDSSTDASNLTAIGIPSGTLDCVTTYYWKVRHQDNHDTWSEWSEETSFTTMANQSPNQPSNTWPLDGATGVSLPPILQSSAFSDPDSGDTHAASQWQITATSGYYSSPVFDSGTDTSKLTSITISSGTLQHAITYYWRVRHQDNHGAWSEWSEETQFTREGMVVVDGGQEGEDESESIAGKIADWIRDNWSILAGAVVGFLLLMALALSIALRRRRQKEVKEWKDEGYRW